MPETLSYQITLKCPIDADVRQSKQIDEPDPLLAQAAICPKIPDVICAKEAVRQKRKSDKLEAAYKRLHSAEEALSG